MNLRAPIISIGAGRSGSTLLMRLLNLDPRIDFKGETSFLLPRIWLEVWHDKFWLNWPQQLKYSPRSATAQVPTITGPALDAQRERIADLTVAFLASILDIDTVTKQIWGYKEVWNGLPPYDYPWDLYDAVVPAARWLHLLRDPFDFARSCARWNGDVLSPEYVEQRLRDWCIMNEYCQARASRPHYFQIRYEDLVHSPRSTLAPLFRSYDLDSALVRDWTPEERVMQSSAHVGGQRWLNSSDIRGYLDRIPRFAGMLDAAGYAPPTSFHVDVSAETQALRPIIDLRDPDRENTELAAPQYLLRQRCATLARQLAEATRKSDDCRAQGPELIPHE